MQKYTLFPYFVIFFAPLVILFLIKIIKYYIISGLYDVFFCSSFSYLLSDNSAEQLPQMRVVYPEASYLVWMDFLAFGLSHADLNRRWVDNARVALNDDVTFGGKAYEGCFRMNIGCPLAQRLAAAERMANAIKGR